MRWSAISQSGSKRFWVGLLVVVLMVFTVKLATRTVANLSTSRLQVVTTSNILGDLVQQVGQERVDVHSLLRPGVDPHTYQPVPADLRAIAKAQVVALHGLGLDAWVERLLASTGTEAHVVVATSGIRARLLEDHQPDPHCWLDPNLVQVYVQNILAMLVEADLKGATYYEKNAAAFIKELEELDGWIEATVARLPTEHRKLVTNHDAFAYFAGRYGFQVVGTLIPSLNPEAEPSARQLSSLVDTIRREDVRAVFTENTVPTTLATTLAAELGHQVRVIPLYTGSLSEPGGPADTYVKFMRHNTLTIVEGLL